MDRSSVGPCAMFAHDYDGLLGFWKVPSAAHPLWEQGDCDVSLGPPAEGVGFPNTETQFPPHTVCRKRAAESLRAPSPRESSVRGCVPLTQTTSVLATSSYTSCSPPDFSISQWSRLQQSYSRDGDFPFPSFLLRVLVGIHWRQLSPPSLIYLYFPSSFGSMWIRGVYFIVCTESMVLLFTLLPKYFVPGTMQRRQQKQGVFRHHSKPAFQVRSNEDGSRTGTQKGRRPGGSGAERAQETGHRQPVRSLEGLKYVRNSPSWPSEQKCQGGRS